MQVLVLKKTIYVFGYILAVVTSIASQEIFTGAVFFEDIAAFYGTIDDYRVDITITKDTTVMTGAMIYKRPDKLRIDFMKPADQVLAISNNELTFYIPDLKVTLMQDLSGRMGEQPLNLLNQSGFSQMRSGYHIGFLETPNAVPLDDGSLEMVVKLLLQWKNADQGFRSIELSIDGRNFIRRMKAVEIDFSEIIFDFKNYTVNQNIPDSRFEYDSPPTAHVVNNFMF